MGWPIGYLNLKLGIGLVYRVRVRVRVTVPWDPCYPMGLAKRCIFPHGTTYGTSYVGYPQQSLTSHGPFMGQPIGCIPSHGIGSSWDSYHVGHSVGHPMGCLTARGPSHGTAYETLDIP